MQLLLFSSYFSVIEISEDAATAAVLAKSDCIFKLKEEQKKKALKAFLYGEDALLPTGKSFVKHHGATG